MFILDLEGSVPPNWFKAEPHTYVIQYVETLRAWQIWKCLAKKVVLSESVRRGGV